MNIDIVQGSEGSYFMLYVGNSAVIACKINQWKADLLEFCVNCSCHPEKVHTLLCGHTFCASCLNTCKSDICPVCSRRAKVKEGSPYLNKGLESLILACPACPKARCFRDMKLHIIEEHYEELCESAEREPGRSQDYTANDHSDQPSAERFDLELEERDAIKEQERSDNLQRSGFGTTKDAIQEKEEYKRQFQQCPHCSEMWEIRDSAEHIKECFLRSAGCPKNGEQAALREHEEHARTSRKDQMGPVVPSNSSQVDQEERDKRKCIEDEVTMLKETIEGLEKRIERLEVPLWKIVQELRAKQIQRSEGTEV